MGIESQIEADGHFPWALSRAFSQDIDIVDISVEYAAMAEEAQRFGAKTCFVDEAHSRADA